MPSAAGLMALEQAQVGGGFGSEAEFDRRPLIGNPVMVQRIVIALSLASAACGVARQPKSATTVAAYEVPIPTASDKQRFLALLSTKAEAAGFHVDAATDDERKVTWEVSPQIMNATVWRGKDDVEPIASAMDFEDHLGRVWISFSRGEDPSRSRRFRESLMPAIKNQWPATASLPIMPSGAIPLPRDLVRTPKGYVVNPAAASKYDAQRE